MKWLKNIFKRKKSGVPKMRNPPPPPPGSTEATLAAAAALYAAANQLMLSILPKLDLHTRLQQAIESENFEEAARLRDLMNKK